MIDATALIDGETLVTFRRRAGVTQTEMAAAMGMPLRSYQDIEKGPNPVRPVHIQAARMALIELAIKKEDSMILYNDLEEVVRKAAALLPVDDKKPV